MVNNPATGAEAETLKLRAILKSAVAAIVTIDALGRIETVNPAAEQMFGHAAGEIVGRNISMLMPEPYRSQHDAYLAKYLATGRRQIIGIGREVAGLRKDGAELPIEASFSSLEMNGQPHFVGFIRDITERKRAERELRENEEQFQVARDIQQHLFPKHAPAFPGFDIAGATYPAELTAVRLRCPNQLILLPGIGAQAGDLEASLRAGLDREGGGLIVTASRSIIYAAAPPQANWPNAVRQAAIALRDAINAVRVAIT